MNWKDIQAWMVSAQQTNDSALSESMLFTAYRDKPGFFTAKLATLNYQPLSWQFYPSIQWTILWFRNPLPGEWFRKEK